MGGIQQKRSHLHQGWVRAPPTPFASPVVHLKVVASLLGAFLKALLANIAILFRNALSALLASLPLIVCI